MATRGRELLTHDQREEFVKIPLDISDHELGAYYTLSQFDHEIIKRHRRDHNRLGFAVQLCVLRYPGWSLTDVEPIPKNVLHYIARQINVDPNAFDLYAQRIPTKYEHLEEIKQVYGYKSFSLSEYRKAARVLLQTALKSGNIMYLLTTLKDELRKQKIILPGITTMERLVWETRKRAEEKVFNTLTSFLSDWQKQKLNELITPSFKNKRTPLAWLREIPGQSSPDAFLKVIDRLKYIREIGLKVNTDKIHPNRLLQLARVGSRYDSNAFNKFTNENKRYAIIVAYLLTLSQDLIDQAIEIHDRQMMILQSKGRKQQEEIQKENGKSLNEKIVLFTDIGVALIKARNEGLDPFKAIETIMPWGKIVESVEEAKLLARPMDYDYLDLLQTRYSYLRKYSRTLLNELEFGSTQAAKLNIIFGYVQNKNVNDPHNLGKSALVHLIDFMLLKEVKKGSYFYNKKKVFKDHTFYLEIELNNGEYLTIRRSFNNITRVDMKILEYSSELLECDEWDYTNLVLNTTSENVTPATAILNEKLNFDILRNYDYRKLVGYFIRTQNDYSDVFQLKKFSSSTDQVWKPFVYELLGFESDVLLKRYELNNEIENLKTKIKNMEDYYSASDIDRINGQIDILTREKDMLEQDLDSFNFYLNEKQISKELIKEIENKSISLQNKAYNLRSDIELIENSLATKEFLDFDYIKELFTEVEIYFSDQLEKSYEELINFNKSLLEDRRVHLSKLLSEKKIELKIVDDKLKEVGKQRSNILNVLQDNDVINKYKHLRSNLIEKEKSIQSLETQKEIILQTRTDIKELNEKKKELEIINETIDNKIESGNKVLNDIRYLFKTYFEKITSKNGIIDISTNTTSNVEFNAGIITDNGTLTHEDEGFSYRKMLCMCFDLAILSYYSNKSFFKFLYHDGPFEALHENRKESYLEFIEDYCADNDVQYIISLIDSDVSSDKLNKEDIVCKLEQNEDGSGALFGFKY